MVACAINMTDDYRDDLCMSLSVRMQGASLEVLEDNGTWRDVTLQIESSGKSQTIIRVAAPCRPMRPAVIRFKFPE